MNAIVAPELDRSVLLGAVDCDIIRRGGESLVICGSTGAWAVLNERGLDAFTRMKDVGIPLLRQQLDFDEQELTSFASQLYDYGLLRVNGQLKTPLAEQDALFPFALLVLKLTNKCNMWCKYCYNEGLDDAQGGIPLEIALKAVDSALEACERALVLVLHGGEPLLQFDRIRDIVDYSERRAAELGKQVFFSMQTNGTLLSTPRVEFIREHDIGLGVSFDGPDWLNDQGRIWRSGKGSSPQILEGISLLKDHGLPVNIITVVTSANASHLLDVVHYLQHLGCRSIKFSYFFPQGRGELFREFAPDPEEIVRSLRAIVAGILVGSISTVEVDDVIYLIDGILFHNKQMASMCSRSPCGAGKDMMTVFPSGKIYACDCLVHPDFELGNIASTSLTESARHRKLIPLNVRTVENLHPCSSCIVRSMCGGTMTCRAFWSNGSVNTIDSSECFVKQSLIEELMWALTDSKRLVDYYVKFKKQSIVKPVSYA